jgi:hypothetical protein
MIKVTIKYTGESSASHIQIENTFHHWLWRECIFNKIFILYVRMHAAYFLSSNKFKTLSIKGPEAFGMWIETCGDIYLFGNRPVRIYIYLEFPTCNNNNKNVRWAGKRTWRRAVVWAWHRCIWTVCQNKSVYTAWPKAATGRVTTTTGQVAPSKIAEDPGVGAAPMRCQGSSLMTSCGKRDSRTIWVDARTASTSKTSKHLACFLLIEIALINIYWRAEYKTYS